MFVSEDCIYYICIYIYILYNNIKHQVGEVSGRGSVRIPGGEGDIFLLRIPRLVIFFSANLSLDILIKKVYIETRKKKWQLVVGNGQEINKTIIKSRRIYLSTPRMENKLKLYHFCTRREQQHKNN